MGGTLSRSARPRWPPTRVLVGRIGTPGDVAALIGVPARAGRRLITAATYDINGGLQIS